MKRRISLGMLISLLGILTLNACKNDNESQLSPASYASSYFNFTANTILYYEGDSIIFNDFNNSIDTVHFYYKDSLHTIDSLQNQTHYEFERYVSYDELSYTYLKTYSIIINSDGVVRNEDLASTYLLPFIFSRDSKWNGNQYKSAEELVFSIDSMDNIELAGATRRILKVKQIEEENLIREDNEIEYYVQGLGMSRRYSKNVDKELVTKKIKSGSIVNLVLKP
jgi:hypothetical protein